MRTAKNRRKAIGEAPEEFSLISRETLLALYRGLLVSHVRQRRASWRRGLKGVEKFAAAYVAVGHDRLDGDTTHFANQPVNLAGLSKEDRHDVERKLGAVMTTSLAQALGAAMLNKTRKNGKIALVWGGAPENDPWLDVLEAARAHTLPVIFVADADRPNRARKSGRRRHTVLKPGKQLPAITVDGNDVVALYRVAHEAIDRARRGRGPTLIELATYRLGRRTFANAVADMENYLRGRGLLRLGMRRELMAGIETMLAREVTIE